MRIKKTSQYIEGGASLSNTYGTSNENGYTQEYINNLETYSTDEVRVGTWIDGKPVYRRSFQVSKTSSEQVAIMTINNLDVIVSLQTYLKRDDLSSQFKNINNWGQQSTDFGTSYVNFNVLRFDSNYTGTLYGTVEYTKTTD